ncbi:DUF4873 domain-containing protein [Rhodococcus sp. NPDC003382]|uniref:DUF4873 domain-containing protein n=1 Tax=unclassified Rhodococcus (in: high G+C Gram-positive bacteria) TaxID=192944 RepID=UPI0018CCBB14|nr:MULTISPECIES: DUF4873 domain-containing protein [unclassified Rhodococcus (in: high G+C Gram-positive bacteria)]MBH0123029.1 DUF4873 domain-containing protein [Rhodococcus sp. CX]MCK8669909.1 DUF4873 domain-containing protein [Rhodococcus sp. HM1]
MSEGFRGRAEVAVAGRQVVVDVELADWFDPISGRHRWRGRLRDLASAFAPDAPPSTGTELTLTLLDPDHAATATARVTDIDLWGSHMIDGISPPPYPVGPDELDLPDDDTFGDTHPEHR